MGRMFNMVVAALVLLVTSADAGQSAFGVVMDLKGGVTVKRGGAVTRVDIGSGLVDGDSVVVEKGAQVTVVDYAECQETSITGPANVDVSNKKGLSAQKGALITGRKLPVCFEPEKVSAGGQAMGAFTMRSMDMVADLRKEAQDNKATVSTLITIVMYDLDKGEVTRARPYYEQLVKQAPESGFVKELGKRFTQ